MNELEQYELAKSGAQQQSVGAALFSLEQARQTNPDEFAGVIGLSRAAGVPPVVAEHNRDAITRDLQRMDDQLTLGRSQLLSDFMLDPNNARLAHDDLDKLTWLEGFFRGASGSVKRSYGRIQQGLAQARFERFTSQAQRRDMTFSELVTNSAVKDGEGNAYPLLGDVLAASVQWLDNRAMDAIGTNSRDAAVRAAEDVNAWVEYQSGVRKSVRAEKFQNSIGSPKGFGEAVSRYASAISSDPLGALAFLFETSAESAPQMAAALGVTALTRNPSAGVAVLGAGSYATERYTSPYDFLKEKGIDLGNPEDIGKVVDNPELLKEAADRGVIRGTVVSFFDTLSGGIAGKTLAANPLVDAVAQTVQQAVSGGLGEYFARKASGQDISWSEVLTEAFAEMLTTPVDMMTAGRELQLKRQKAKTAEATKEQIDALADGAAKSKLKARMPDAFRALLDKFSAGSGVENVFVPGSIAKQYFQDETFRRNAGIDDAEYQMAIATDGDVRIPVGGYAAHIVGTPVDEALRDHLRFDPEAMTAFEAREFNARASEIEMDMLDEAQSQFEADQSARTDEEVIYDEMVSKLRAAGRSTEVAKSEAMIYPAFFRAMASRAGTTVADLKTMFMPPAVRGELPEGLRFKDIDELDRELERLRMVRPNPQRAMPLLEWLHDYGGVSDPGGELKSRNADTVRRPGKSSLRLARRGGVPLKGDTERYSMDTVARAAMDAGLLSGPLVDEYRAASEAGTEAPALEPALLDAIDRELSGETNDADMQQAQEAEAYFESLGVSLNDDNATIKRAIRGAEGKALGQFIDPLDHPGPWRDKTVTVETEDGQTQQVNAGDAVDYLKARIKAAEELLACVEV